VRAVGTALLGGERKTPQDRYQAEGQQKGGAQKFMGDVSFVVK
jgi:hypothetical protein